MFNFIENKSYIFQNKSYIFQINVGFLNRNVQFFIQNVRFFNENVVFFTKNSPFWPILGLNRVKTGPLGQNEWHIVRCEWHIAVSMASRVLSRV